MLTSMDVSPEVQQLAVSLAAAAAKNSAQMVADQIRSLRAGKKSEETIAGLEEIISEIRRDTNISPEWLLFGDGHDHMRLPNSRDGWFAASVKRAQRADPSFPRVTPHDLRHTAASLAVSAGANVKAVQRMLGHASAAMTLDVYSDLFDDDLNAVSKALDKARRKAVVSKKSPKPDR